METKTVKEQTPAKKDAAWTLAAVLLFALGLMLLPARKLGGLFIRDEVSALLLGSALFRTVGCVVGVLAARRMGLRLFQRFSPRSFLLCLPFAVVVAGNFPIGALIGGDLTLSASYSRVLCFTYYCIAVGFFEEIVFRGIVLPLCLPFFTGKFRAFWAAVLGSAIFALCHFVNLLGAGVGEVFMQVGYSFLVGGMCATVYFLCPNVALCAGFHALFDFGGFMAAYLGLGMVWGAPDITLTAVTAVVGTAYALWLYFARVPNGIPDFWIKRSQAERQEL